MQIPQLLQDKVAPLDRERFQRIREAEFTPHYDIQGLKYLRDRAGRERDLRELYRGRAPYELLQNADDAKASRATFILTNDGLAFAHNGDWFTVDNFRSLADGWSDKDPKQCIGHKGLGFRSVLDITPAPHLVKVDQREFFAVKFTWALNNGHIQKTLQQKPDLRAEYDRWTAHGQIACPVMTIPGPASKQGMGTAGMILDRLVRGDYGGQYTTMFWFPARDPDIPENMLRELGPMPYLNERRTRLHGFLEREVGVLLPFLSSVSTVELYEDTQRSGVVRTVRADEKCEGHEITVSTEVCGRSHTRSFFQMRLETPVPPHIRNDPETPKALKSMDDVGITFLVQLQDGYPRPDTAARFHVYFPTDVPTGVGFIVHADFYVTPDRKHLMDGAYNGWLLGIAAQKAADDLLPALLQRYPPRAVFAALSPDPPLHAGSDATFVNRFSLALQQSPLAFIPTRLGKCRPSEVVLAPATDDAEFWDMHFSDAVEDAIEGRKAFVVPDVDQPDTRSFLQLTGARELAHETFLELVDAASRQERSAEWWYDCYTYLSHDSVLSHLPRSTFHGHHLIPITKSRTLNVPSDRQAVVCLPPSNDTAVDVPSCFSKLLVFLDPDVATDSVLSSGGKATVASCS